MMSEEKTFAAGPIVAPLTGEMLEPFDAVDVIVKVSLGDLIYCGGIDALNDLMDERIVGEGANGCLADIYYTVVGHHAGDPTSGVDGDVLIRVQAQFERF